MENIDKTSISKLLALTEENQVRRDLNERRSFLRWISQIIIGSSTAGFLLLGWMVLNDSIFFPIFLLSVSTFIPALAGLILSRPAAGLNQIKWGCYIITFSFSLVVLAANIIYTTSGSLAAAFLPISLIAGVLGLSIIELSFVSFLNFASLVGIFLVQKVFNLYKPVGVIQENSLVELALWIIVFAVCISCLIIFAIRTRNNSRNADVQSRKLRDLLTALNSTTDFSSNLSRELSQVINDLRETSQDQSVNTQEQVAAVTEVTASLEELSETAIQIANSATSAAMSANQALAVAFEVKGSSELSRTVSLEGNEAIEEAVASVEKVRNRIELLGQRLLNLTEQTRRVGSIIDIIDEIADETHLLALNASIEAAGNITTDASKATVSTTTRGERFGVIAQEIKSLSDRSREATEEVRQAISEMQGAVAAAVLVAEEGKKETSSSVSRSQIAGAVINKLNEVIIESAGRAGQILEAAEEVKIRCDEISIATSQQRSANQQILSTMRNVAQAAKDSAGTVGQLSETVLRVNSRVDELNNVLGQSGKVLQPI